MSVARPSLSRRAFVLIVSGGVAGVAMTTAGCVRQAEPAPFVARTTPPPWDAPRDAISHIREAGLPELPLNDTSDPHVFTMTLSVAGKSVEIPAHVGVDRVRAVQAPVHTHDTSGQVWLEGQGNREVTLGQLFTLWGVRTTDKAFGQVATARLQVSVDGEPSDEGLSLVLRTVSRRLDVVVGEA